MTRLPLLRPAAAVFVLLLAACADQLPSGPAFPRPPVPAEALMALDCTAEVRSGAVTCAPHDPASNVRATRILGGQGVNVRLAATGMSYDSAAQVYSMNVTVQNLLLQRMGTYAGNDVDGVYVFFSANPSSATGTVSVRNADGEGFFTGAEQPYFHWPEVLARNAVSQPKRWEFNVPPSVASFQFQVYVQARLLPIVVFDLVTGGNRDIYRVALDGGELTRLTTHAADERNPTASTRTVVFVSYRNGNADLYSMPLAGGTETRLTTATAAEGDPALTRDGTRLAYTTTAVLGVAKTWTANADMTGAARATPVSFGLDGEPEASPAWAPQSGRLALVATRSGSADVYDLTLGGVPSLLRGGSGTAEVDPGWSLDGTRLAYTSNGTGGGDVYVLRLSDGQLTRLTSGTSAETYATWTADGRIVYLEYLSGGGRQLRWTDPDVPGSGGVIPITGSPDRPYTVPF